MRTKLIDKSGAPANPSNILAFPTQDKAAKALQERAKSTTPSALLKNLLESEQPARARLAIQFIERHGQADFVERLALLALCKSFGMPRMAAIDQLKVTYDQIKPIIARIGASFGAEDFSSTVAILKPLIQADTFATPFAKLALPALSIPRWNEILSLDLFQAKTIALPDVKQATERDPSPTKIPSPNAQKLVDQFLLQQQATLLQALRKDSSTHTVTADAAVRAAGIWAVVESAGDLVGAAKLHGCDAADFHSWLVQIGEHYKLPDFVASLKAVAKRGVLAEAKIDKAAFGVDLSARYWKAVVDGVTATVVPTGAPASEQPVVTSSTIETAGLSPTLRKIQQALIDSQRNLSLIRNLIKPDAAGREHLIRLGDLKCALFWEVALAHSGDLIKMRAAVQEDSGFIVNYNKQLENEFGLPLTLLIARAREERIPAAALRATALPAKLNLADTEGLLLVSAVSLFKEGEKVNLTWAASSLGLTQTGLMRRLDNQATRLGNSADALSEFRKRGAWLR